MTCVFRETGNEDDLDRGFVVEGLTQLNGFFPSGIETEGRHDSLDAGIDDNSGTLGARKKGPEKEGRTVEGLGRKNERIDFGMDDHAILHFAVIQSLRCILDASWKAIEPHTYDPVSFVNNHCTDLGRGVF